MVNIKAAYTKLSTLNTKPQLRCTISYTPQSVSYIIKDSSCFLIFDFLTLLHPYAETLLQLYELRWMGGDDIMEKAFTWTLCFDVLESRKFKLCHKQSNGECLMGMFYILLPHWPRGWCVVGVSIYISAWGFRVARFDRVGQCESLSTWDE